MPGGLAARDGTPYGPLTVSRRVRAARTLDWRRPPAGSPDVFRDLAVGFRGLWSGCWHPGEGVSQVGRLWSAYPWTLTRKECCGMGHSAVGPARARFIPETRSEPTQVLGSRSPCSLALSSKCCEMGRFPRPSGLHAQLGKGARVDADPGQRHSVGSVVGRRARRCWLR